MLNHQNRITTGQPAKIPKEPWAEKAGVRSDTAPTVVVTCGCPRSYRTVRTATPGTETAAHARSAV
jgi:hypothetical protein